MSWLLSMDQPYAGLIPRANDDGVQVDVTRPGRHEGNDFGDILGTERSEPTVDLASPILIPAEAHEGELGVRGSRVSTFPAWTSSQSREGTAAMPPGS